MPERNDNAELIEAVFAWRDLLSAYAFSILRDWHLAEDVVQDAFLLAGERIGTGEIEGELLPWLRGVVRLKCFEMIRAQQREAATPEEILAEAILDGDDSIWNDDAARRLRDQLSALRLCLDDLPAPARHLLQGFYVDGKSGQDLAAELGKSHDSVRAQLYYLRGKLRSCIESKLNNGDLLDHPDSGEALQAFDHSFSQTLPATGTDGIAPAEWLSQSLERTALVIALGQTAATKTVGVTHWFLRPALVPDHVHRRFNPAETEAEPRIVGLRTVAKQPHPARNLIAFPPAPEPAQADNTCAKVARKTRPWLVPLASAAAVLLLTFFALWKITVRAAYAARTSTTLTVTGNVALVSPDGTRLPLTDGTKVPPGYRIVTAGSAEAILTLDEGRTTLRLGNHTSLLSRTPPAHGLGARGFFLETGYAEIEAAPQPFYGGLVFETEDAAAHVVGTRFFLMKREDRTVLSVTDGEVGFSSPDGRTSTAVSAGEAAEIRPGGHTGFTLRKDPAFLWETFPGAGLASVRDFPSAPRSRRFHLPSAASPVASGENFGGRLSGKITIPSDGEYRFFLACDNDGQLWRRLPEGGFELLASLSSDKVVMQNTGKRFPMEESYTVYPEQASTSVFLKAGETIELVGCVREDSGYDHISIGWQGPDFPPETLQAHAPGK